MGAWYAPPVRRCAHIDRGHQERTESRPPGDRQEKFGGVTPITIYIDADACPVKQEIYRVAERHALKGAALKVFVVTNSPIAVPRDIFVGGRPDAKPGSTF